jgi:enoyl-CoA hydratase/carnithine racemase
MALGAGKRAVKMTLETGESNAIEHERVLFGSLMNTADKKEGVAAFLEKRKA